MPSLWTLESSSSFGTVRDFDDSFRVLHSGCTTAPHPTVESHDGCLSVQDPPRLRPGGFETD